MDNTSAALECLCGDKIGLHDLQAQLREREGQVAALAGASRELADQCITIGDPKAWCSLCESPSHKLGCKVTAVYSLLADLPAASKAILAAAEREPGLREALVRTGKWAPLAQPPGYLMCRVCCTGMRCECGPGEHVARESCPNCLGKSGSIFARAALAQEEHGS